MGTETLDSILRFVALIAILVLIFVLGWNEPLKYRFMSRAEIYALENPPQEAPEATGTWMWSPSRKTMLDRGAHSQTGGLGMSRSR